MTILSVVQNVALAVGLERPDVVMSSTDREMQELVRIAGNVAILIRDAEFDWQALQKIEVITGDGVAEAHNLPDDYARMNTQASLWSSRWSWGFEKISDLNDWLDMIANNFMPMSGQWIIYGDQLHILPVTANTETVRYVYISNLIVKQAGGALVETFSADNDTFRLDEHLLELGIIWKYKAQKGQITDEDENDFNQALYTAMNTDKGSKNVISGNARRTFNGVKRAWPYTVGP